MLELACRTEYYAQKLAKYHPVSLSNATTASMWRTGCALRPTATSGRASDVFTPPQTRAQCNTAV